MLLGTLILTFVILYGIREITLHGFGIVMYDAKIKPVKYFLFELVTVFIPGTFIAAYICNEDGWVSMLIGVSIGASFTVFLKYKDITS
jgi:hypothetical protein